MTIIKWIFFDISSTLVDESAVYENDIRYTGMAFIKRIITEKSPTVCRAF